MPRERKPLRHRRVAYELRRRVGEFPIAIAKTHGDARTIDVRVKAGALAPSSTTRSPSPPLPAAPPSRTSTRDEFRDPWLPKWDPGSRM